MVKKIYWGWFAFLFLTVPLFAAEPPQPRLIHVSDWASIEQMPDTAWIDFGFEIQRSNPEESQVLGEKVRQNIFKALKVMQIPTENIYMDSSYMTQAYLPENQILQSYNYQLRLRLHNFQKITDLRQKLLSAQTFEPVKESWFSKRGLNVHWNVSYEVDQKRSLIERQLFLSAFQKAWQKSQALCESQKLKCQLYQVQEEPMNAFRNQPVMMMQKSDRNADQEETAPDTVPCLQKFQSRVVLQVQIL